MPMTRRRKRLLLTALFLLFSLIVAAVVMKYFPFTKLIRLPAADAAEFEDSTRIRHDAPNAVFMDFEVAPGKEMPSGCYKGVAHSGEYSVKAFGQNSFSMAVERTAGQIGIGNLTTVALSAWIYVFPTTNDVKGSLVFTASNSLGVNVCWHGVGLVEPEIPREKWFKISGSFDLTSVTFDTTTRIQVYFWNNSNTDILVDDYTVVFGGAKDRRGDSTLVDLTRPEGYQPCFNCPPFPEVYLEKEEIKALPKPFDIHPADMITAGDFFGTGTDALFIVHSGNKRSSWIFCPSDQGFRQVTLSGDPVPASIGTVTGLIPGRFTGGPSAQVVITGTGGWILGEITTEGNICKGDEAPDAVFRILSGPNPPTVNAVAGDFDGNRIHELLLADHDGSWQLLSYRHSKTNESNWKPLANSAKPLPGWTGLGPQNGLHAGRFIPGPADQLMIISTNEKGEQVYTLKRWNSAAASWQPVTGSGNGKPSVTVGYDTLRPTDRFFFPGQVWNGHGVFRYNRDWRFDLKTLRFADTTFSVLHTVGFRGFPNDQNPKYYESLVLVPGHFKGPASWSVIVMGHNDPAHGYATILPDFIQLYTPKSESRP